MIRRQRDDLSLQSIDGQRILSTQHDRESPRRQLCSYVSKRTSELIEEGRPTLIVGSTSPWTAVPK